MTVIPIISYDIGFLHWSRGYFMAKFLGVGLVIVDREVHRPFFSVRYGYERELRLGRFGIGTIPSITGPGPMGVGAVDYDLGSVPARYACGTCGAWGCKLWREHQTFLSQQTLSCCDCASKISAQDVSAIDEDGKMPWHGQRVDSIGWRVPAIPTEDGKTFWGYTSVPPAGVRWWRRLPTRCP